MIFLLTALCDNKSAFTGIRSLLRRESFQVIMMIYRLLGKPIQSPRFTTAKQIAFALLSRDRRDAESNGSAPMGSVNISLLTRLQSQINRPICLDWTLPRDSPMSITRPSSADVTISVTIRQGSPARLQICIQAVRPSSRTALTRKPPSARD